MCTDKHNDDDADDERIDKSAQNGTRRRCTEFIMMNLNVYKHLNFPLSFACFFFVARAFLSAEVHFKSHEKMKMRFNWKYDDTQDDTKDKSANETEIQVRDQTVDKRWKWKSSLQKFIIREMERFSMS